MKHQNIQASIYNWGMKNYMDRIFDEKIIGYSTVKKMLYRIVDTLQHAEKYKERGVSLPHGLLLTGMPGTGKSTLAECFLRASGRASVIFRKDSEQNEFLDELKKAFHDAAEKAPSVILLEDIHLFATGKYASEWAALQSSIDECKDKNIFVVATANATEFIADSLLRPGRFDYIVEISLPMGATAKKIIASYLDGQKLGDDINLEDISKVLSGSSCAALESALNIAKVNAVYEGSEAIYKRHMVPALMEVIHKIRDTGKEYSEFEWRYIAMHETGHAIVCEALHPGQTALVSILSDGNSVAGKTAYASSGYSTEQELMDLVTISLAGKAAVETLLGLFDLGAAEDIEWAADKLNTWATRCAGGGFSSIENLNESVSESSRKEHEDLVAVKLEELYQRAKKIVFENKEFAFRLCDELLAEETGTLLSSDITRICKAVR